MNKNFDNSVPTDEHGCFIISPRKSNSIYNISSIQNDLGIKSSNINQLFNTKSKDNIENNEKKRSKENNYNASTTLKFHCNPDINKKIQSHYKNVNFKKYPQNDEGNSKMFLDGYSDYIRYNVDLGKWYIWEGRYWKLDLDGEVYRRALHIMRIYRKYAEKNNIDENVLKHTIRSGNHSSIQNMLKMAENLCVCHSTDFDQQKHLLNVRNGTIDLRTKQLMRHKQSDMITKLINTDYSKNAFDGKFKKFIEDICNGDKSLTEYLNRVYGYSITGEISEQCIFIELGYGANGKSTLNELCKSLMGNYMETISYKLFQSGNTASANNATPELAKLFNIRLAICSETSEQQLNEAKIKEITGGTELTARPLYKKPFNYMPQFTLIFETNILPHISGFDHGIWRRIVVIPFMNTFKKDTSFKDKLMHEQQALLSWLVDGAYKFYTEGLGECKAVTKASQKYRYMEDTVESFIQSKLIKSKNSEIKSKSLYDEYRKFCEVSESNALDNKKFKEAMTVKGYKNKRKSSGIVWLNIDLKV